MANIVGTKGLVAEVDENNRLQTFATNQDLAQFLNQEGKIFSAFFTATPTGANDFFFYFKNTGTSNIAIGTIAISSTVATQIRYEVVSGTAVIVGETEATVTNLNLGSAVPLTAQTQFGTSISGLITEGILAFEECSVVDAKFLTNFQSSIIIPQGKAVAFRRVEATGTLDVSVGVAIVEL